jgi:hypothetical protein
MGSEGKKKEKEDSRHFGEDRERGKDGKGEGRQSPRGKTKPSPSPMFVLLSASPPLPPFVERGGWKVWDGNAGYRNRKNALWDPSFLSFTSRVEGGGGWKGE